MDIIKLYLTEEEKVLVMTTLLGCEGLQLLQTFNHEEKEKCRTAKEIEKCMVDVRSWMDQIRLKMSSVKTGII